MVLEIQVLVQPQLRLKIRLCYQLIVNQPLFFLGTNGIAVLNPSDVFDGDSNATDIDYLEVDKKDFTCSDLGLQPVVLTVFYTNGTNAVCNAQVTIADNIYPFVQCIAPGKEFILVNGSVTITTADVNAVSNDNCLSLIHISEPTRLR